MMTLALITGYLFWIAVFCVAIGLAVCMTLSLINETLQLKSHENTRQCLEHMSNHLRSDADWFSEDPPTWQLLKVIANNIHRGVSMDVNSQRDQWRKWLTERKPVQP